MHFAPRFDESSIATSCNAEFAYSLFQKVSNSTHSDPQWIKTKRVAVAAEAQAEDADVEIPSFPKTEAQIKTIGA